MFYTPYNLSSSIRIEDMSSNPFIRIINTSPNSPSLDVYLNNRLIVENIAYKQHSDYISVVPGDYNIQVYVSGTKENPIISNNFILPKQSSYTIAAIGDYPNTSLLSISEPYIFNIEPKKSYVKFVHLSPNTPRVDITLPDGLKLFKNVQYKQATDYIEVNPKVYTLQVRISDSNDMILTIPNFDLKAGIASTMYLVGLSKGNPGLEIINTVEAIVK